MARGTIHESKAWIFVSHSTRDFDVVRKIRNYLEKRRARPLLFFLRCLEVEPELVKLLSREIEARDVFLLCNSDHARQSTYVQKEIEIVRQHSPAKIFVEIELAWPWHKIQSELDSLLTNATVYVSYDEPDGPRVRPYIDAIVESDLSVYRFRAKRGARVYGTILEKRAANISKQGTLLIFASKDSFPANLHLFFSAIDSAKALQARPTYLVVEIEEGAAPAADIVGRSSAFNVVRYSGDVAATCSEILYFLAKQVARAKSE